MCFTGRRFFFFLDSAVVLYFFFFAKRRKNCNAIQLVVFSAFWLPNLAESMIFAGRAAEPSGKRPKRSKILLETLDKGRRGLL